MGTILSITNPDGTIYSEGHEILISTGEMTRTLFKDWGSMVLMAFLRDHDSYFSAPCGGLS
jgi:hypothetical protein